MAARLGGALSPSGATTVGGAAFVLASTPWLCGVAAFLGMLNAMGRDRGGSSEERLAFGEMPGNPA